MVVSKRVYGVLYLVFIALVIWLADIGSCQTICGPAKALPYGDKIGHFVLVGLLAASVFFVFRLPRLTLGRYSISGASAAVIAFISLEEFSQNWFPERTADWGDLGASYLGILCFELIARRLMKS